MRGNFWWEGWKVTEWARTGRLGWGGRGRLWDNWDVSKRGGECRRMWDGRNAAIKSDAIKLEHGGKLGCEENSRGSCYRRLNVCPGITAHELATSALCFLIWSCPPSAMAFVLALMGGYRDSQWFQCRTESIQWCAKLLRCITWCWKSWPNGVASSSLEPGGAIIFISISKYHYSLLVLELSSWKSGAHNQHMMAVTDISDVVFWTQ